MLDKADVTDDETVVVPVDNDDVAVVVVKLVDVEDDVE